MPRSATSFPPQAGRTAMHDPFEDFGLSEERLARFRPDGEYDLSTDNAREALRRMGRARSPGEDHQPAPVNYTPPSTDEGIFAIIRRLVAKQ